MTSIVFPGQGSKLLVWQRVYDNFKTAKLIFEKLKIILRLTKKLYLTTLMIN